MQWPKHFNLDEKEKTMSSEEDMSPEELWKKSMKLHKDLANKFHSLTTAAAFGTLWFLLSLEQHLPLADSQNAGALKLSWYAASFSCVFGTVHLFLDMFLPLHSYNIAAKAVREFPTYGAEETSKRAKRRTNRCLMWGIPARLHFLALAVAFLSAGFYRFSNF